MHVSTYTFRFSVENGAQVLLYNALTGALDLATRESIRLMDAAARDNPDALSRETIAYLLRRGYLYPSKEDEQHALETGYREFKEREAKSNLRLVIVPTYQCNSRCAYCFIGDPIGQEKLMDDETMDRAFTAMDALAERHGKDCTRQLSLFGGEPLIDTPAQRRVVERILREGSKRGFLIDAVTNGFDLVHYTGLLRQYGVTKVQVTFDGLREYHNQRRPAVDGKGASFDRIVAGVDAALSAGLEINARILLDRNSIRSLPGLVAFFKEKRWFDHPGFTVHLGSVFDCFRCQPPEETVKHLGVDEGNQILHDICTQDRSIAELLAIDWQGVRRFVYTGKFFPPTYKTCFGGNKTFAFDLNGGIYACETTAGRPEYQIGTFSPDLQLKEEMIDLLERRNILNIPACRNCGQALLCAGGCTFNAVVKHGSLFAPGCRMLKETLQYGLDYYWPDLKARLEPRNGPSEAPGEVESFYAEAAKTPRPSLCCPSTYDPDLVSHVPAAVLARSYGCGSPVLKAGLEKDQTVVDLGCGAGIDVFLAARFVGPGGRVLGVDMTGQMLAEARANAPLVARNLGFDVVEFRPGRMEQLPVADGVADVVISNCSLNLAPDKQKVFAEIARILKPGGRFVIADVVADKPVPETLKQSPALWNECISGALLPEEFVSAARDAGLAGVSVELESSWQRREGVTFFSALLRGIRGTNTGPCVFVGHKAIYKGPLQSVTDDDGHVFPRGTAVEVCVNTADALKAEPFRGSFLVLDPDAPAPSRCCEPGVECAVQTG